jgi:hypothetical protein
MNSKQVENVLILTVSLAGVGLSIIGVITAIRALTAPPPPS